MSDVIWKSCLGGEETCCEGELEYICVTYTSVRRRGATNGNHCPFHSFHCSENHKTNHIRGLTSLQPKLAFIATDICSQSLFG